MPVLSFQLHPYGLACLYTTLGMASLTIPKFEHLCRRKEGFAARRNKKAEEQIAQTG